MRKMIIFVAAMSLAGLVGCSLMGSEDVQLTDVTPMIAESIMEVVDSPELAEAVIGDSSVSWYSGKGCKGDSECTHMGEGEYKLQLTNMVRNRVKAGRQVSDNGVMNFECMNGDAMIDNVQECTRIRIMTRDRIRNCVCSDGDVTIDGTANGTCEVTGDVFGGQTGQIHILYEGATASGDCEVSRRHAWSRVQATWNNVIMNGQIDIDRPLETNWPTDGSGMNGELTMTCNGVSHMYRWRVEFDGTEKADIIIDGLKDQNMKQVRLRLNLDTGECTEL